VCLGDGFGQGGGAGFDDVLLWHVRVEEWREIVANEDGVVEGCLDEYVVVCVGKGGDCADTGTWERSECE